MLQPGNKSASQLQLEKYVKLSLRIVLVRVFNSGDSCASIQVSNRACRLVHIIISKVVAAITGIVHVSKNLTGKGADQSRDAMGQQISCSVCSSICTSEMQSIK